MTKSSPPAEFTSLTLALENWFDKTLAELPLSLRLRVEEEFLPLPWDELAPEQRRSGTLQRDYQNDPATEGDRKYWWDFFQREDGLKQQVQQWTAVTATTTADLAMREKRLSELGEQLAQLEREKRRAGPAYYPRPPDKTSAPVRIRDASAAIPFVAYPKAMGQLAQRLNATPEELAAWVFWGPELGGIAAYLNANELDPPPRFSFPSAIGEVEYLPYLMRSWFMEEDLRQFVPKERFITGQALINRWGTRPGIHAEAYIRAKIAESRLMETHPLTGFTQATDPEDKDLPPMTSGLFALSDVEKVEEEDFPEGAGQIDQSTTTGDVKSKGARPPTDGRSARKVATQKRNKSLQAAYRTSKRARPEMSDVWHAKQISKLPIAKGISEETIRRNMKP